jgi:hypothetical protein
VGAAELVIGNLHYEGGAGLNASAETAAELYRRACTHHVAAACFDLGWMHETGTGVPADVHLAKRYYDNVLEEQKTLRGVAPGVSVPVNVALWRLASRDSHMGWRDGVFRPLSRFFGVPSAADALNWVLQLPPYVPPVAGASPAKATVAPASQSIAPTAVAAPAATAAPAVPSPPASADVPADPKAAVKAALARNKASRTARQRAASLVSGLTAAGGQAVDTLASIVRSFADGFASTLASLGIKSASGMEPVHSLLLLASLLALGSVMVRALRARRE